MKDFSIGKRLYKSTALLHFKILFLTVASWVLINLYFKTYSDPDFLEIGRLGFKDVVNFHVKYPVQFLGFLIGTLYPALYYAFFRGIHFHEQGMIVNKGLPLLNHCISYENIENFKIIHPKYLLSIRLKGSDEELLFTIKDIDRVVAILDQKNIAGNLNTSGYQRVMASNKKFITYFAIFGMVVSTLQYTGFFIWINRILFR